MHTLRSVHKIAKITVSANFWKIKISSRFLSENYPLIFSFSLKMLFRKFFASFSHENLTKKNCFFLVFIAQTIVQQIFFCRLGSKNCPGKMIFSTFLFEKLPKNFLFAFFGRKTTLKKHFFVVFAPIMAQRKKMFLSFPLEKLFRNFFIHILVEKSPRENFFRHFHPENCPKNFRYRFRLENRPKTIIFFCRFCSESYPAFFFLPFLVEKSPRKKIFRR